MYRQCKTCVMDTTAKEIIFTNTGCNFCDTARQSLKDIQKDKKNLNKYISQIKKDGKGKKYDCLIGLSGGIDSSTVLIEALKHGLRPLCYAVDNGWQSLKAQENIMRLVEGLKVPFYRYNIDLKRFAELQSAFLKAGQLNLEIPTDHILLATTYEMADMYDIKWVLSGGNVETESIMPASWGYNARDLVHIKSVYKWFTGKKLKGLPTCGLLKWNWYKWVKGIKIFYLLDYVDYKREPINKFGFEDYGEKHCENIFTWWFQNYYLFEKFGIDKRKAHLSSVIVAGHITRDQALLELEKNPIYPQIGLELKANKYKHIPHTEFKTDERLYEFIRKTIKKWKS